MPCNHPGQRNSTKANTGDDVDINHINLFDGISLGEVASYTEAGVVNQRAQV
jgi:hypothetical protein